MLLEHRAPCRTGGVRSPQHPRDQPRGLSSSPIGEGVWDGGFLSAVSVARSQGAAQGMGAQRSRAQLGVPLCVPAGWASRALPCPSSFPQQQIGQGRCRGIGEEVRGELGPCRAAEFLPGA